MPFQTKLRVEKFDYRTWMLIDDLIYEGDTQRFIIPAGYLTDFASVPESLLWLIYKTGPYTEAAVVHDYLLTHRINATDPALRVSSRDADGIFRRIMREQEVKFVKRWAMWAAVRWGALFSKERAPGRQFWKDAPAVLFISLLAAIPVGIVSVPAAIIRSLLRLLP